MWIFISKKCMTDSEKERKINSRLAFEETNRWLRTADNSIWVMSSLLLAGTGYGVNVAINMEGKNWRVILLGDAIILLWVWFRRLLKGIDETSKLYFKYANRIEKELEIDMLPDVQNNNLVKTMIKCSNLVWFIWGVLIVEYIYLNFKSVILLYIQ